MADPRLLDDPDATPIERALLASARTDAPADAARARIAAQLAATAAAGTAAAIPKAAWIAGAGIAGVAVAVLALYVLRDPPAPAPSPTLTVAAAPPAPAPLPGPRAPVEAPATIPAPAARAPGPSADPRAPTARRARTAAQPPAPAPTLIPDPDPIPPPGDAAAPRSTTSAPSDPPATLSEELALLAAARTSLARQDARAALATLARYRARFPDGTLSQEAAILAIESHLAHLQPELDVCRLCGGQRFFGDSQAIDKCVDDRACFEIAQLFGILIFPDGKSHEWHRATAISKQAISKLILAQFFHGLKKLRHAEAEASLLIVRIFLQRCFHLSNAVSKPSFGQKRFDGRRLSMCSTAEQPVCGEPDGNKAGRSS